MKHALWSVWKETGVVTKSDVWWCVQFPKGVCSMRTKRDALKIMEGFKKGYEEKQKALR
jgi:hypothetical protein